MKKIIIILAVITSILVVNKKTVIIPKQSIRFRIIANSNNTIDQSLKMKILSELSSEIKDIENVKNIDEAREKIKKEIPKFTEIVDKTLKDNNYNKSFHINYGKNFFPRKQYKNVVYEEGDYESVVISLGDGEGKNFWCVLFPPLCLIDEETQKNTEYKSFVKEIIDKYF